MICEITYLANYLCTAVVFGLVTLSLSGTYLQFQAGTYHGRPQCLLSVSRN